MLTKLLKLCFRSIVFVFFLVYACAFGAKTEENKKQHFGYLSIGSNVMDEYNYSLSSASEQNMQESLVLGVGLNILSSDYYLESIYESSRQSVMFNLLYKKKYFAVGFGIGQFDVYRLNMVNAILELSFYNFSVSYKPTSNIFNNHPKMDHIIEIKYTFYLDKPSSK